ncbi:hypothetical protein [Kribbella sp. VKM Ac-2568]|uniref:hypothetical protein n=1 Tax=Kribbella sp. VKM Ac-2568 TaxID=2512219 RepID=UPI001045D736|nr:hypothetical protein [Kribbella sp. VKM Ac-2568]TCM50433.1 hypothetical protein EV648_102477 [Kribbella sp. VKM Ac-2568]
MRDNGLTASAYTSLGGIDPLVAEPVLAALAEAGIAAYAGAPGEPGPSASEAPAEPAGEGKSTAETPSPAPAKADEAAVKIPAGFEEIFVASGAEEQARAVIERSTEDAEWASLVEQFNAPSAPGHDADPVPQWPASEEVDENSYEPLIDVPSGLIVGDTDEDPPEEPPARRTEDPHDHYVPPEPPRGPKLDWISRAAWLGLLGGPVLLILAALLDFGTGRITTIAVVGFIAGFLTLVIRMKDRLPPDDTPDDGAIV